MQLLGSLFHTLLIQPLVNVLAVIYFVLPVKDMGIAIILFTVLSRIAFFPLTLKAMRSQKALSKLQPQIKEIQKSLAHDREAQGRAIMQVYKENKVNPFSSLVPILIQLPILIALYRVLLVEVKTGTFNGLYPFMPDPGTVSLSAFAGVLSLASPSLVLAVIAGVGQFFQSYLASSGVPKGTAGNMGLGMNVGFAFFTLYIAKSLPAALTLYWAVMTLVLAAQQYIVNKMLKTRP